MATVGSFVQINNELVVDPNRIVAIHKVSAGKSDVVVQLSAAQSETFRVAMEPDAIWDIVEKHDKERSRKLRSAPLR